MSDKTPVPDPTADGPTTDPPTAAPSTPVPARRARGQVTSYGDDRLCEAPDCTTRLSRYNGTSHCAAHEGSSRSATGKA